MTSIWTILTLLASPRPARPPSDSQRFFNAVRSELTDDWAHGEWISLVLIGVLLIVVVIVSVRFLRRQEKPPIEVRRDYLPEIVSLLQLGEQDAEDVRTLVSYAGLPQPVALLLSPANLAHAARSVPADERDPNFLSRCRDLCRRLFDADLPEQPISVTGDKVTK